MAQRTVAVVGGGIAGFATALAFAKQGAEVVVFEQARQIAEVGAGVQITPNGARVLCALGLAQALDRVGIAAQAVVPTDGSTGRPIARFGLEQQSPRYRFVHRANLIGMLQSACAALGVHVRTGHRIGQFGQSDIAHTDLVVGADGIRSVMRGHLNGPGTPFFTGQVAWRAVVAAAHPPEARIWMAPQRHVVTYPLQGGMVNIVAVEEREAWAGEGWRCRDDPDTMRAAFASCAPELRGLLDKVSETYLWGLFRHEVAPVWHDRRVVLAGDAAHPTLPFLAQGANLALEDAWVLAACCAGADLEAGLARYQALRRPRVIRAIAAANANAVNFHLAGARRLVAQAGLKMLGKAAPSLFLRRMDWLYGHDVTQS